MNMKRIAIGLAVLVLAVGVVVATAGPHGRRGGGPGGFGFPLEYMTDALNLTETQQGQIKAIMESEKPNFKALHEQQRNFRKQMDEVTKGGAFDEAKVRSLAQQQSQSFVEMAVTRARVKSKIWSVLTTEQRQKAEQMKQRHESRMGEKFKGEAPPPEAE
jgi:periplasmic protein CpxP/Spy